MPGAPSQSRFLDINGLLLHHLDWGNLGAAPLVFVHGLSGNAHNFDAPAERFRERFHVISVDVRGRGDSAWSPEGAYQHADYVSDLEGVVDQLGLEGFVLAGTSMGGRIAMDFAGRHPERVAGLVVNDIGPDGEPGSERIRQSQGSFPPSFGSLDEVVAFRAQTSPVFATLPAGDQLVRVQHEVRQGGDGRYSWKHDPVWQKQRFEGGSADYTHLWRSFENYSMPVLLLWGTISDVLSEAQALRMVAAIPDCELVPVPGAGHAPTLSEPAAVEGLERFLSRILARPIAGMPS